ncbi:uncharacterized protein LOC113755900 [Coffea eugenioides]|uniref:uncharacterized protein LOC113755900 n=1 Tax=Coffea eugenioides TaxID=49369 RepID=UPI000F614ECE|nr:uncharacterized protein LOC113755900 [Coffea eugenioides]
MNCSKLTEDRIPELGMEFNSEEDTYKFYNKYAFKMDFSIRKNYLNKDKDGVTTSRRYSCYKESVKCKYEGDVSESEPTSISFDEHMFIGCRSSIDSVSAERATISTHCNKDAYNVFSPSPQERNSTLGLRLTIDINSPQLQVDE